MKWMTVTALATATVFGSFVESVEADIIIDGNSVSGRRSDDIDLRYEFSIFSTDEDGNLFRDEDNKNSSGSFLNAVVDFESQIFASDSIDYEVFCIDKFCTADFFDRAGSDALPFTDPFTLNLNARLFTAGERISLPNGDLAIDNENDPVIAGTDRIEYILFSDQLDILGITEIALIIEEVDSSDDSLDLFFSDIESLNTAEKQIDAVNSLEYIIENQVLSNANSIRVSGPSSTGQIVSRLLGDLFEINVNPVSVPEPVSTSSLLGLGLLGVGLRLKRRF